MTVETRDGARARIYRTAPSLDGLHTAAVGGFHCDDAASGAALLSQISGDLVAEGFAAILGPMDGDTWHNYRLVTESDGSPPFLLEPTSTSHDLQAFETAGFAPVARYFSARTTPAQALGTPPAPIPSISIRTWDGNDPEGQFSEVHRLSTEAFRMNQFYAPIGLEDFLGMYMQHVPLMKKELVLMANDSKTGALIGFVFGLPNYQEGPQPSSVIFKTYASLRSGVGHLLSHAFHQAARDLGFETVIHALIHDDNRSASASRKHGAQVFRRYALMGRKLSG